MAWQLVIHDENAVAELLQTAIESGLGDEAHVHRDSNFEGAARTLKRTDMDFSLIVLGSNVPRTAKSPGSPLECGPACEFINAVRGARKIPVMALAYADEPDMSACLRKWDNTVMTRYEWPTVQENARRLHNSLPLESKLELEIALDEEDRGTWRIDRKGVFAQNGALIIRRADIEELIRKTAMVPIGGPDWQMVMDDLGKRLEDVIFGEANRTLSMLFFKHRAEVGGTQNVRIIFTMAQMRQGAMMEALQEEVGKHDFWMLKTPIERHYSSSNKRSPVFADAATRDEPVNCLIINANPAAGKIGDGEWRGEYARLPEIDGEVNEIEKTFQEAKAQGAGIGDIERLDFNRTPDDFQKIVRDKLNDKTRTWHIVHFAGHGTVSSNGKPGLVLDASIGSVLSFENLITFLERTRFLFVSSCRSANQNFISKAIQFRLPAILGFRWPAVDLEAAKFAATFYARLLTKNQPGFKSLDHAFLWARRAAHERNADDNTWASALLLKQL